MYRLMFSKKARTIASSCTILAVGLFLIYVFFIASITVTATDDGIKCSAPMVKTTTVAYQDIESISIESNLDYGSKSNGFDSPNVYAGLFYKKEYDEYYLYVYRSCDTSILMHTTNGVIVINAKDETQTQKLYDDIMTKIK